MALPLAAPAFADLSVVVARQMVGQLLAQTDAVDADSSRLGSMLTFFLIALVLVAPFGFARIRRTTRDRRIALGLEHPGDLRADPTPFVEPDPSDVAAIVATLDRIGRELKGTGDAIRTIQIPPSLTLNGRPSPASVTEAILADAARRNQLRLVWSAAASLEAADAARTVEVTPR